MTPTVYQLEAVIIQQLGNFDTDNTELKEDTLVGQVFANPDDVTENRDDLFVGNMQWTLWKATSKKPKAFPPDWKGMTVKDLATALLSALSIFIIFLCSFLTPASAQLQVNLAAAKTTAKSSAIQFAFSYIKSLDSLYSRKQQIFYGKSSYFMVTPEIDFQTGSQDAFSSVVVKATGLLAHFKTTTVSGLETPDGSKGIGVFPISIGAETNNQFAFLNGVIETGYDPFYQSYLNKSTPDWIKRTRFAIFLQAGYKFKWDSSSQKAIGGQVDQSGEQLSRGFIRAKAHFSIDTKTLVTISSIKIGLVGSSTAWWDFSYSRFYYKLTGTARIYLSPTLFFDLAIDKGSGAPNFNTGEQFSGGLTVVF